MRATLDVNDKQRTGQGAGSRFKTPAALALLALALFGCSQGPVARPQPSPSPQMVSTATATVPVPQAAPVTPTQPSGVAGQSYVAYASGLATTFTEGYICGLEQPFVLKGDAPPVSSGLVANFTPSSATQGTYSFTNNILEGSCVDSSSGSYTVSFYTPEEGEIVMTGDATRVCSGVTTFLGTTEFRVSIRSAPLSPCP